MLEFYVRKINVSLSFTFFALIAALTVRDGDWGFRIITALFCCIIHELGHVAAMCCYGVPPQRITFYAGGIKITKSHGAMISERQDIIILAAGCAVNFTAALLLIIITGELNYFACANLFLGFFNLMPIKYFDGGRILAKCFNDSKICDFIRALFIAVLAAALITMLITGRASVSLAVTFAYILLSEIL